jgi:hypothetical protein
VASSMDRSAARIAASAPRRVRRAPVVKAKPAVAPAAPVNLGSQIEVYRGTKSDQVKVGGTYGG